MPRGFDLLISRRYLCSKRNSVRAGVWPRHCSMEFMKQVLPRFESPTLPAARGVPCTDDRPQPYDDPPAMYNHPSLESHSVVQLQDQQEKQQYTQTGGA